MEHPAPPASAASDRSWAQDEPRHDHPLLWLLALEVLSLAAALLPIRGFEAQIVFAIAFTGLYVWFVVRYSSALGRFFNLDWPGLKSPRPLWQVLAATIFCAALWAASEFALKPFLQQMLAPMGPNPPLVWRAAGTLNYTLRPLMLVSAAACGGVALSRLVKYPNMLGPLAGVAALIDIWGVLLGGIVSQLLTSPTSAPIAQRAMAQLPTVGGPGGSGGTGGGISIPSVGAGDFLFLGLFFGVLWAHRMEVRAAVLWIAPLVTVALLAIAAGAIGHLPGLLFIGVGAVAPNLKYLRYTREERFALVYALVFVAFLTAALYFLITSQLK